MFLFQNSESPRGKSPRISKSKKRRILLKVFTLVIKNTAPINDLSNTMYEYTAVGLLIIKLKCLVNVAFVLLGDFQKYDILFLVHLRRQYHHLEKLS